MSKTELLSRAIDCLEVLDKRDRPMCRDCADMAVDGMCPNSGIACDMGELIAQCRAALTQPAQPAEGGEARELFAYHSDMGIEFFNGPDAEAAAKSLCEENLKLERAEAISTDEWADDRAESIRWGVVLGRAKFFENPGQEGEDSGDYKMVGYTAPPASQEQMSNGLTEAETSATASVMGLTTSQEQAQQPASLFDIAADRAEVAKVLRRVSRAIDVSTDDRTILCHAAAMIELDGQAQQPSGVKSDFGPWSVSMDGQYIDSDDFEHDVKLVVQGDFRDDVQRRLYACDIAQRLSQQPSGVEVDFAQAIVAESHGRYTLATSRAAFQAGAIYGQQLAALATPKPEPMTWQPIETAPENTGGLAVVRWVDDDGQEHIELDCTEDGCWIGWHDHAEHVEIIGGHGVSYTPPYTQWLPLSPTGHHGITKEQA